MFSLLKKRQHKEFNESILLDPKILVSNYQKILEFIANKLPNMRWEDNFLDEDICLNNTDEITKFHRVLKQFYIDYPLSTYKVKLYCDKKCKYLFEDLYNKEKLSQDISPITYVKSSFILNGKVQYKMIKISNCDFTLKQEK